MGDSETTGFRLSPQQARLWLSSVDAASARTQGAIRVRGGVDPDRLRAALDDLVARHEILRTAFHTPAGMRLPVQVIGDRTDAIWRRAEAEAADGDEQVPARILEHERDEPLDLARGPVVRALLTTFSAEDHLLCLTLPAACADAGTLAIVTRELAALYAGGTVRERLAPEPLQYADYSAWQHELREAEDEDALAARAYWREHEQAPAPVGLPFALAQPSDAPPRRERVSLDLDGGLVAAIESQAGEHGDDGRTLVLGCWLVLLGRLSGQTEVILAHVGGGREEEEEVQELLGPVARALPLRASVASDRSFPSLLEELAVGVGRTRRWQDQFSAESEAAAVGFEWRERCAQKVGDVSFALEELWTEDGGTVLTLACARSAGSLRLELTYDAGILERAHVERIARSMRAVLASAVNGPAGTLGGLDVLDQADRRHVVVELNQTAVDHADDLLVHELFERQARLVPEAPALVVGDQRLSYAELNARANRLAHALRARGVGPDECVGVFLERSAEAIVAILAILKAAGAYVPLATEHPPARLAHQLTAAQIALVITTGSLLDRLPLWSGQAIVLDRDAESLAGEPTVDPPAAGDARRLAYVIYTSGSTGVPKGVAVTHRGIANYARFIAAHLGATSGLGQSFAHVSALATDLGNTSIFAALTSGGCLHLIDEQAAMDGSLYAEQAAAHPIDVLKITPSHLTALLATAPGSRVLPRRHLVLGGEAASWDLVDQVRAGGVCAITNHYGPTEATVGSLTFPVLDDAARRRCPHVVPIGRPIDNTVAYIVDERGQPVPLGVAGELWLGGAGVARGYIGQPDQTAARFRRDPFRDGESAIVYSTGDRARHLPDGNIEFLGRVDHQIKLRGHRIEPAEVEQVIRRHPGVEQVVVVLREDRPGDQRLVAYVTSREENPPGTADLRALLLERLPEYMVPSAFVVLASMPLTATGKLDRNSLPAPGLGGDGAASHVEPRDATEQVLAAIWTDVLGIEAIGVFDDFFELGGHSLLATQVIARIRNAFGVQLPLHSLFTAPTIAGLAEALAAELAGGDDDPDLAQMLEELEGLSDEEALRMLSVEAEPSGE